MKPSSLSMVLALLFSGGSFLIACTSEVATPDDSDTARCGPEPEPRFCGPYTCVDGAWKEPCCGPPDCCGPKPKSGDPACSVACNDGTWFASCPCPADLPAEGSTCPNTGVQQFACSYENEMCGYYAAARCQKAAWQIDYSPSACCPDAAPIAGTGCDAGEVVCSYETCSGQLVASCAGGSWTTDLLSPPPPCSSASTEVDCSAIPGCRYFFAGCVDEPGGPPGVTGCFAVTPCDPSGGPTSPTCTEVSYDPCQDKSCEACSATTTVCLP